MGMAHRLVEDRGSESHQASATRADVEDSKSTLNRRQYVKLGAASLAILGPGALSGAASDSGTTYYTDFSGSSL